MDTRCRVELFGWLRVKQAGRVITRFRSYQTGALLAYLAFYRQRSHPREALIEILWPGCDPASDTWSALPPMPTARWGLGAAVGPDGKGYAIGGSTDYPGLLYTGAVATAEMYDPATKTWTKLPSMKNTRVALVALAGPDGTLYTFVGTDDYSDAFSTVEAFTP